jgi:hypothetical protein
MTKDIPIRDIPTIKKPLEDLEGLKRLKDAMPILQPALRSLGVDTNKMDEIFYKVEELGPLAEELASMPDKFNDLFSNRGWIYYESLNCDFSKSVIKKAESGDLNGAETDLVNYYNEDTINWNLRLLKRLDSFNARWPLARKALIDYNEGRYHACVPVILALLDGMVAEAHLKGRGSRKGFFAENADLEAWNSISGHSRGLKTLAGIFNKGRYKTNTEPIDKPYRHGIVHGMDLGYDNKMVAAKAWAALFSVRDWAEKAERGLLDPGPAEKPITMEELIQQLRENEITKAQLNAWKPRDIKLGREIPITGGPNDYETGTPEQKLAEYLSNWKARKPNYRAMADCVSLSFNDDVRAMPIRIKSVYGSKILQSFEFIGIRDTAAARTVIKVKLIYEEFGHIIEKPVEFIMICKNANREPAIRDTPGSNWVILFWNMV